MKIALSSWSLHREIPKNMDLVDFIKVSAERFGINAIELCQQHFTSTTSSYIDEIKKQLEKCKVKVINVPIDVGDISQINDEKREKDISLIKNWINVAKEVGSPYARVNTGKSKDEGALDRIIKSYKELVRYAENLGMGILLENHGGISNDPEKIVKIVKEVNSPSFGTCPDFGNFPEETRYKALEIIAPYALVVHAKTYEFDSKGEETKINIKKCIDILKKTAYKGYLSIEFEGPGDEFEGVEKSKKLLERYL